MSHIYSLTGGQAAQSREDREITLLGTPGAPRKEPLQNCKSLLIRQTTERSKFKVFRDKLINMINLYSIMKGETKYSQQLQCVYYESQVLYLIATRAP